MAVLQFQNLSKDYRQHFWTPKRRVLNRLNLEVEAGEVFGFLGPNGAGKSTAIKITFEIIFPSEGEARLFGKPLGDRAVKRRVGFLPENSYFYDYLTAEEFLNFHGQLCGLTRSQLKKRIPTVLEEVGMKGTSKMRLRSFSKGMLQRVGLAQAILHDPELVVLDEPMTGLDPMGRKEVRDLMIRLRDQGKTIFFSTHILSDVESICDRVAILNKGQLLQCGRLEDLVSLESKYVEIAWNKRFRGFDDWMIKSQAKLIQDSEKVFLQILPHEKEGQEKFENRIQSLIHEAVLQGGALHLVSHKQDSLEDIFVKQVGPLEERV